MCCIFNRELWVNYRHGGITLSIYGEVGNDSDSCYYLADGLN
jgi:hypothetical protein